MATRYFGTDGIRGRAGTTLTPELALRAAFGMACCITGGRDYSPYDKPEIALGRDCRLSSPMLADAVRSGINLGGCNVIDLGIVPTPVVTHMVLREALAGGIMITASHNPIQDNGIKFFGPAGFKLEPVDEADVEAIINSPGPVKTLNELHFGEDFHVDPTLPYLAALRAAVPSSSKPRAFKVVLDCAYGATAKLAARAFERAGYDVHAINNHFDGAMINVNCGATNLRQLSQAVCQTGAELGLAFDGDGDRMLAVDHTGQPVSGDKIIALFATRLPRYKRQGAVVMTHMTNVGVEQALAAKGVRMVRTEVGDVKVLQAMLQQNINLGGEQSGHIIMLDKSRAGDGILAGLQLASILRGAKQALADMVAQFPEYPQQLTNLTVRDKQAWQQDKKLALNLKKAQARYKEVRFYLRPSGTENLVRVLTEAIDDDRCHKANAEICELIAAWDRSAL